MVRLRDSDKNTPVSKGFDADGLITVTFLQVNEYLDSVEKPYLVLELVSLSLSFLLICSFEVSYFCPGLKAADVKNDIKK